MLLKDYINHEITILQEQVIGREITIADTPVLLLGMQECREESEELEDCARLYLIYEDEPDEPDWDEEPDLPEKGTCSTALQKPENCLRAGLRSMSAGSVAPCTC